MVEGKGGIEEERGILNFDIKIKFRDSNCLKRGVLPNV